MKKDEIVKEMIKISGSHSTHEIFSDWVMCCALAIQNACTLHDKIWEQREQLYLDTMKKYNEKEQTAFYKMFALLAEALGEKFEDVLGYIFMHANCASKSLGQCFTPDCLSKLCSDLAIPKDISPVNKMTVLEPSIGGGGMIIGVVNTLINKGIDYGNCLEVVGQDLDWRSVYMSYVQLSLLGVNATIVQGDTLADPYVPGYPLQRTFRTPKHMGVW